MPSLLRIDADRELGTLTSGGYRWVYRDRRLTWAYAGPEEPPRETGPEREEPLAELWAEARAGFPNTRFTWTSASTVAEPGRPPADCWRLELPFEWARFWAVYVGIQEDGRPTWVSIFVTAGEYWELRHTTLDVRFDVPLMDDTGHRFRYPDIEEWSALRPWHELDAVRSPFRSEYAGTAQPPAFNPQGRVASDFTAAAWDAPCVPGVTSTAPVHLTWKWYPSHAKSADRALMAMVAGCRVSMEATFETQFTLTDGASSSFEGELAMVDVGWSAPIENAWSAPTGGGKRWTRLPFQADLPKGVSPERLTLVLDGTLTWTCTKAGPATNQVGIALVGGPPELHWPGCYPEYGFLTGQ